MTRSWLKSKIIPLLRHYLYPLCTRTTSLAKSLVLDGAWETACTEMKEISARLKIFCLLQPGENCLINYFSFISSLDLELVWQSKSISHKKCDPGQFSDQIHRWQSSVETTVQWQGGYSYSGTGLNTQNINYKGKPSSGLLKHEFPPSGWNSLCAGTEVQWPLSILTCHGRDSILTC